MSFPEGGIGPTGDDALAGPEIEEPGAVSDDESDGDAVDTDVPSFTPWRSVLSVGAGSSEDVGRVREAVVEVLVGGLEPVVLGAVAIGAGERPVIGEPPDSEGCDREMATDGLSTGRQPTHGN